jgi:molybdopterin converting factor small subunit
VDETSPIQVRITAVSSLGEVIGNNTLVSLNSGSTVGELIDKLEEEFGSTYKKNTGEGLKDTIKKLFNISINGKLPTPGRPLDETLCDGDEIVFFQWTGA